MLGFICALPELRALWGEAYVAFASCPVPDKTRGSLKMGWAEWVIRGLR